MSHFFYYEHPETKEPAKAGSLDEMAGQVGGLLLGRSEIREHVGDVAEESDRLITRMVSGEFGDAARVAADLHLEASRLLDAVSEYYEYIEQQGVKR
jgi:hypothetical protein